MFRGKASVVKNLMVVGKLSILLACSPAVAEDIYNPKFFHYQGTGLIIKDLIDISLGWLKRLDDNQKAKHAEAITHSLLYTENGQSVTWYQGNASGMSRVVMTWPTGSGYCRRLHTQVIAYNTERTLAATACYHNSSGKWQWAIE